MQGRLQTKTRVGPTFPDRVDNVVARFRVAVVIPIRDEALALGATVDALLAQDYPADLFEILILDGGSKDDWRTVLPHPPGRSTAIRSLDNPRLTTAAAVNLALRATEADAILWISGHCVLSPNYISAVVADYAQSRSRVVGGRLDVVGQSIVGWLNAMVLSSPFGTGMAPLRFERTAGATESVTFALYDRQLILDVGGLDERLVRNQDTDLWDRLRDAGARFRRVDAVATYLAPPTFAGLWRRALGNGRWNIWGQRVRRGGLSWWHFAPMAMVGTGLLLSVGAFWSPAAFVTLSGLTGLYAILAIVFSVVAARQSGAFWAVPILPFLFFAHHVIYGLGSWSALFRPVPSAGADAAKSGAQRNGVPETTNSPE